MLLPTNLDEYKNMLSAFRKIQRKLPKGIFSIQYEDMLDPDLRLSILSKLVEFIGKQNIRSTNSCKHNIHLVPH
jgi:hypothetical protein